MNIEQIKTLEEQSAELIENIILIKQELDKKISTQTQFEAETVKIVNSLTKVVCEFSTIKTLFQSLGNSEMTNLFSEINQTHGELKTLIPDFNQKLNHGLSEIKSTSIHFEEDRKIIYKEISSQVDRIVNSTKTIENLQQESNRQFELMNSTTLQVLQQVELKLKEHEKSTTEKINWILDKLNDNAKSHNHLSEKTDKILNWLETNGEVLISNSRTGIFGRKK